MILPWNRREAYVTMSMQKQAEVRDRLTAGGVAYILRTVNRNSPSPFYSSRRGRERSARMRSFFAPIFSMLQKRTCARRSFCSAARAHSKRLRRRRIRRMLGARFPHSLLTICSV